MNPYTVLAGNLGDILRVPYLKTASIRLALCFQSNVLLTENITEADGNAQWGVRAEQFFVNSIAHTGIAAPSARTFSGFFSDSGLVCSSSFSFMDDR